MVVGAVAGIDRANDAALPEADPTPAQVEPSTAGPTSEPTAEPTADPTPAYADFSLRKARRVILRGTNRARASEGREALRMNRRMNRVAQRWSQRMASSGSMSHNPVVGDQIPSGWSTWAENVAYGFEVRAVVRGWMNSPGHRENILRDVNRIGIGVASSANGTKYYTQVFGKY